MRKVEIGVIKAQNRLFDFALNRCVFVYSVTLKWAMVDFLTVFLFFEMKNARTHTSDTNIKQKIENNVVTSLPSRTLNANKQKCITFYAHQIDILENWNSECV